MKVMKILGLDENMVISDIFEMNIKQSDEY
jgi:hypothetical protein